MNPTARLNIKNIMVAMMFISGPTHAATPPKAKPVKANLSSADLEKLVHAHSAQTIPQAARFLSLAMQAWNPSLRNVNIYGLIMNNIKTQGVIAGLVNPALAMMDISFAARNPEFANLLNPMLNQVVPGVAGVLNRRYGMALDYEGRDFDTISRYGNADIWTTLTQTLGGDFYSNNPEGNQPATIDQRRDMATQIFQGRGSYFAYQVQRELGQYQNGQQGRDGNAPDSQRGIPGRRNDITSTPGYRPGSDPTMQNPGSPIGQRPGGVSSTPSRGMGDDGPSSGGNKPPFRTNNRDLTTNPGQSGYVPGSREPKKPIGPFSNRDLSSYESCLDQCFHDAESPAKTGAWIGGVIGAALGGRIAQGTAIGAVIGAIAGADECRRSKACGGTGGDDKGKPEPSEPKTNPEPKTGPEPKQPKEPKEPKEPKTNPQPDPDSHPTPDPKPEPKTAPEPKPEDSPKPHPDKTPPEAGHGDDNGGDDDPDDKDDNARKSISLGKGGRVTVQIPGVDRKPIIPPAGRPNPINTTPSFGPRD